MEHWFLHNIPLVAHELMMRFPATALTDIPRIPPTDARTRLLLRALANEALGPAQSSEEDNADQYL